jgi:hypothetical protein
MTKETTEQTAAYTAVMNLFREANFTMDDAIDPYRMKTSIRTHLVRSSDETVRTIATAFPMRHVAISGMVQTVHNLILQVAIAVTGQLITEIVTANPRYLERGLRSGNIWAVTSAISRFYL